MSNSQQFTPDSVCWVPVGQDDGRTQQQEVPQRSGIEPRLSGPIMQSSQYMAQIMLYVVTDDPYFI